MAEETNSRRRGEQTVEGTSDLALSTANSKSEQECNFCGYKGHTLLECHKLVAAHAYACKPRNSKKQAANTTSDEPETAKVVETAGNASSNHKLLFPVQIDGNFDWNADSGATLHSHWIHNYKPFHTPICLANNYIVYSAGIGSVIFIPVVGGKTTRAVELT